MGIFYEPKKDKIMKYTPLVKRKRNGDCGASLKKFSKYIC
jgi:hypothetical protein